MRIAINTLSIAPHSAGAATYLSQLLKQLFQIDEENDYYLICSSSNHGMFTTIATSNVSKIVVPFPTNHRTLRVIAEQVLVPLVLFWKRADLLFAPRNVTPLLANTKSVVVMHSMHLNYKYRLDKISWLQRLYGALILPASIKTASKLIAISDAVKDTIIEDFSPVESKVKVIYHGLDVEGEKLSQTELGELIAGLDYPYILFLSSLARHKNADKLIKAYALIKKHHSILHKLLIAGKDMDGNLAVLEKLATDLGVEDQTLFPGRIPQKAVKSLYEFADVFVFPSAIEGFGFPPLEAMACGTPVVGSNRTSVPEIIGDAGIIVDPDNISALAEAIWQVISDQKLRQELIQKGYERVRQFTWQRTAEETLRVFEEVHNKVGGK